MLHPTCTQILTAFDLLRSAASPLACEDPETKSCAPSSPSSEVGGYNDTELEELGALSYVEMGEVPYGTCVYMFGALIRLRRVV